MQQAIGFVQQAGTAFYTRHFTKAVYLLRRALQALPSVLPYPQPLRWALLDLLEMVESWYQGLPMLEASAYSQELLQVLKQWLEQEKEDDKEQEGVQDKLTALDQLLEGLWVGFDFFDNNNLSLELDPPLIAFQIEADGQIQLYKFQEHTVVNQLIAEFKACFELQLDSPVDYAIALKPLLEQKQWTAAEALLQKQLEQFPNNQRLAFVSLGELHFLQEHYQKAMEAYMKAVMLGTPKDQVKKQVQEACNALARTTTDKKAAARWRQILIDFF